MYLNEQSNVSNKVEKEEERGKDEYEQEEEEVKLLNQKIKCYLEQFHQTEDNCTVHCSTSEQFSSPVKILFSLICKIKQKLNKIK